MKAITGRLLKKHLKFFSSSMNQLHKSSVLKNQLRRVKHYAVIADRREERKTENVV